jgi:hypothetical protein
VLKENVAPKQSRLIVCMHLCTKHFLPVVNETKFLGLIFDSKLSFKSHIAYLKNKCLKAMNLLGVVANTDWGADSTTLLRLYRSIIRSKLDYRCIVYGSARDSYILRKELAPVCDTCLVPLTVEHIVILFSAYASSKKKFFADCVTLFDLFTTISSHVVISFLKEIDIYCKV